MKSIPLTLAIFAVAGAVSVTAVANANTNRDAFLQSLASQAEQPFSAERGSAFFKAQQTGGKPDTPSCDSCHKSPTAKGETRAGKEIEPMAISVNPERYTDPEKIEKWFGRNCRSVLGRECSPQEKGDFITFMLTQ